MSEGSEGVSSTSLHVNTSGSTSAIAAEVDDSPLQKTMDKNKESLKVKLMMRRPLNQLVAQGIIPSLKTPPAFHEQRQKLERAKTGDLLKAKIQQRPDREELVRQHILEADMGHVDPSLAERQRMLKKARLADSLNDQLSHRPGPLELIKKNILHTEEPIERAVKEGVIPFKATSEGQLRKPQHPDHYVTFEDDSQSSESAASPSSTPNAFGGNSLPTVDNIAGAISQAKAKETRTRDVLETAAASAGIVNVAVTIPTNAVVVASPLLQQIPNDKTQTLQTFAELCSGVMSPLSLGSSTSSLSPLSSIASPPTPLTPRPNSMSSPAPGKADKNRKKSKTKTQPKTRTIKFHEYKGPPNAQKSTAVSASSTETSYELLLQQQQLFLQWQLEWQHKYPQIILPAAQKPSSESLAVTNSSSNTGTAYFVAPSPRAATPVVQTAGPQSRPPSSPPQSNGEAQQSAASNSQPPVQSVRVLTKLEDMKVSDLKMELKKRNLPVSGPKPQLIERLKAFAQGATLQAESSTPSIRTVSVSSSDTSAMEMDVVATSPSNQADEDDVHLSPGTKSVNRSPSPSSPIPTAMDTSEPSPPTSPKRGDNIIQQQQRKIEELQKELQKSQQQLQQIRQGKDSPNSTKNSSGQSMQVKTVLQNGIIHIDPKSQQKLILQQHLQNKIQQQQLQLHLQQQQNSQPNEVVNAKASLAAFINQQQAQQQLNNITHTDAANTSPNSNNSTSGNNDNDSNNNSNNNSNSNNNNSNQNNSSSSNNSNNNNRRNSVSSSNSSSSSNNNNNNNNINNINNINNNNNNSSSSSKNGNMKGIVLGQQQTAVVLNHLNLVKQKNGLMGHQRTHSLPSILGTIVQNVSEEKTVQKVKPQNAQITVRRAGSEEQKPPHYEDLIKRKEDGGNLKSVKSQIVDDVLEILIKNGELPPSAANDPATPGADQEKNLLYPNAGTAADVQQRGRQASQPPPPPPLPQSGFTVALPKAMAQPPAQFNLPNTTFSSSSSFPLASQTPSSSNFRFAPERSGQENGTQDASSEITFSVGNYGNHDEEKGKDGFSGSAFLDTQEMMTAEASDFNISNCNDQNFHSSSLDYILSSNDNLLSSELSAGDNLLPSDYGNGDINLKELGLDLETLDSMDFSQLDCKMDNTDAVMVSTSGSAAATTTTTTATTTTTTTTTNPAAAKTDQLINNNPELVKSELIEPMDMDDNWLDALMPSAGAQSITNSSGSFEFLHCGDSPYDSILGNTQDPFGLFDIHDADFKLSSSTLSWDKVDFAT